MAWVLLVVAGALVLAGAALLTSGSRRGHLAHLGGVAALFGLDDQTEGRFGLRELPDDLLGERVMYAGTVGGIECALLSEVSGPPSWMGDAPRVGVVVRHPRGLRECSVRHAPGDAALAIAGDAGWLVDQARPILAEIDRWFRIETAGDQLVLVEEVQGETLSVDQVGRMLVMAMGALGYPTRAVEALIDPVSPGPPPPPAPLRPRAAAPVVVGEASSD